MKSTSKSDLLKEIDCSINCEYRRKKFYSRIGACELFGSPFSCIIIPTISEVEAEDNRLFKHWCGS